MHRKSINSNVQLQYASIMLPGLIIFTLGLILPMFLSFWYSMTSWNGMTGEKPFVGVQNFWIYLQMDMFVMLGFLQ